MKNIAEYNHDELTQIILKYSDDSYLVPLDKKMVALINVKDPSKTRVADNIYYLFSKEEWLKLLSHHEKLQKEIKEKERIKKEQLKKRRGFGIIVINQFLGDWSNINSLNERPQFAGTKRFQGTVKGNWLTDKNGKRHKINGNQVVKFNFYEDKEAFDKALKPFTA